jgi:hypothetical protein
MAARRPRSGLSLNSVPLAQRTKDLQEGVPHAVRVTSATGSVGPGDPRPSQVTPQGAPRSRSAQVAARRAKPRRGPRDSRFWPDRSRARPRLRGARSAVFTCAWLTTAPQVAPSPLPTAPQLPAALMEMQPEPLARAAPAAAGPAQATAATPLTTASATPLTSETRLSIG